MSQSVEPEKGLGLLNKYQVERLNDPEGKHADCRYFVLDPLHDPIARKALREYAQRADARGYFKLSRDLQRWLDEIESPEVIPGATLSSCGRYRYRLTRDWEVHRGRLTFVMLNPSTADATQDDPTIRRCIGFARDLGYGGLTVVNLYAFRATKPADLWKADDPVGPRNDWMLTHAFRTAEVMGTPVIAAWGANARSERVAEVLKLPGAGQLQALGVTKDGAPRHPLYLPKTATPTPWRLA